MSYVYLTSQLIEEFGYENVIKVKDILLFISGISIGMLIMLFLAGSVLKKLERVDTLENLSFVEFTDDNKKKHLYVNVSTVYHAVEVLIMFTLLRYMKHKSYSLRSESKAKRKAKIIIAIMILLSIFAVYLITNPII